MWSWRRDNWIMEHRWIPGWRPGTVKLCNNYILICGLNFPSWLFLQTNAFRRRLRHNVRIKQNKCKLCLWKALASAACTGVPWNKLQYLESRVQAVWVGSVPGRLNTAHDTCLWDISASNSVSLCNAVSSSLCLMAGWEASHGILG